MRYILAESGRVAAGHMAYDRKWKRVAQDLFLDEDGEQVKIITGPDSVHGINPERLYLGWGWASRRDADKLIEYIKAGSRYPDFDIVDLTLLPRVH